MVVYASDTFVLPLPEKHRFPMAKYRLLRERLEQRSEIQVRIAPPASDEQLLTVHCPDYLERLKTGTLEPQQIRRLGFPYSPELLERSRRSVGATVSACQTALQDGVSCNLAGGTHHAFYDQPEGFCVFNDSLVAVRCLQRQGRIRRAVILDCDVHQGNGTAALAQGDQTVFTFSIHGEKNFPFRKVPSDLDIALPDGTEDSEYLAALGGFLEILGDLEADLVVYLSGADPFEGDRLGRLSLTKEGLRRRDRAVFERCRQLGLAVAVTMAGGYAKEVEDIVDIHESTVLEAFLCRKADR